MQLDVATVSLTTTCPVLALPCYSRPVLCQEYYMQLDVATVSALVDPDDAFDLLLQQPIMSPRVSKAEPLLFLLDGLDEAGPEHERGGEGGESGYGKAPEGGRSVEVGEEPGRGQGQGQVRKAGGQEKAAVEGPGSPTAAQSSLPAPLAPAASAAVDVAGNQGCQLLLHHLSCMPGRNMRVIVSCRPEAMSGRIMPLLRMAFNKCGGMLEVWGSRGQYRAVQGSTGQHVVAHGSTMHMTVLALHGINSHHSPSLLPL